MTIELYLTALSAMLVAGSIFWLISLLKKDVSIVDSLWALFFIIATLIFMDFDTGANRSWLITTLVLIWGIRLSVYITLRNWGHPEDQRYREIRRNNQPHFAVKSLYLIFGFQALIAWIIALPLLPAIHIDRAYGPLDMLGLLLWLAGFAFEAVADQQLRLFKQNPANKGKILNKGLWRYSRHPNYFGEFLIWWGYFCFALSSGAWWAIVSPLLMSFLLLKFSGVSLLEKTMGQRPGYDQYRQTTNAFFPGPPDRRSAQ